MQQAAMARQNRPQEERRDFWLYIDEVHNFITPSMGEILGAARKYRLGLILAHQELRQLHQDDDVGSAVLTNPVTRIVFRVGDADARSLSEGFAHFESNDLRNLDDGRAICRVERSDHDFNLTVPLPEARAKTIETATRDEVIGVSRQKYALARTEVESLLAAAIVSVPPVTPAPLPTPPAAPVPPPLATLAPASIPEPVTPVAPISEEPSKPIARPIARPLGKGGHEHKRLQQMIKLWAQGMGYRAIIEEHLSAGGQIDVALKKAQRTIACEISITTPNANEIENVRKCIAAGYDFVALISPDAKRIAGLERAILPTLAAGEREKVRFFSTPDALFSFIEEFDAKDANREETVRGYRVKMSHQVVDKASKEDRTKMLAKIVAESLKRTKT